MKKIKRNPVTLKMKVKDNQFHPVIVFDGSVRGDSVSFTIRGGDQWAHLSKRQALKLIDFLHEAVEEIDRRTERYKTP